MNVKNAVLPAKVEASMPAWDAAVNLGRKFLFEEPHGMQVGRLAVSLFDQLAEVLPLDREDRRLLMVAGILHDIGRVVSFERHHVHTFYLVSHSELPGFSAGERYLIGMIARYHRTSAPTTKHVSFARLNRGERSRVVRLSALLRLADALDRDHFQRIDEIRAYIEGTTLTLLLEGAGDLRLEKTAVMRKSTLFTRIFGFSVRAVRTAAGGAPNALFDPPATAARGGAQ